MPKHAISVKRSVDFAEWYQEVIKGSELAEHSGVRGCMIIRPWGWAVWERIKSTLDREIQLSEHENCYFPLFIPLDLISKEAEHVEGFAKEMAVVTHTRLVQRQEGLVIEGELETPLILRPTSETMFGEAMARWIKSYRDLPLKLNQWANVVRWELRPRLFLRTSEFLWQEGHTAHETEAEARQETMTILEMYRALSEDVLRIPVTVGEKSAGERFPGAVQTFSIEAMMQDGRALQAGTSHYLGTNFAEASGILFQDRDRVQRFAHTTSWGVSTRLIGALIMTHGDDDGLRLPPILAPKQVVVMPVLRGENDMEVLAACRALASRLSTATFGNESLRVLVDGPGHSFGTRRWSWIKKGVPVICELGPRDIQSQNVIFTRRDRISDRKISMSWDEFMGRIPEILTQIGDHYYNDALEYRNSLIKYDINDYNSFRDYFKSEPRAGWVIAKWSGDPDSEVALKELGVSIRCLPLSQNGDPGVCVLTGKPALLDAVFSKAY